MVRANSQAAFENIALWHERDISHSSVERVILADSAILTDYLLAKTHLAGGRHARLSGAHAARIWNRTQGLIFSGQLLLDLAAAGMLREQAYQTSANTRHARLGSGGRFPRRHRSQTKKSFLICRLKRFRRLFPWTASSTHVDRIFRRVFRKTFKINNLRRYQRSTKKISGFEIELLG